MVDSHIGPEGPSELASPTREAAAASPAARGPIERVLSDWPQLALHLADALALAAVARGADDLTSLLDDLPGRCGEWETCWGFDGAFAFDEDVHRAVRWLFVYLLSIPHPDGTAVAAQLTLKPLMFDPTFVSTPQGQRAVDAQTIVQTRPTREVRDLLGDTGGVRIRDPEMGLLLVHERCVLGHAPGTSDPWYLEWGRTSNHPLAVLPGRLLPIEGELPNLSTVFGVDAENMTLRSSAGLPWSHPGDVVLELGSALPGIDGRIEVDEATIGAPFREWTMNSNGRVEVVGHARGSTWPSREPAGGELCQRLPVWMLTPERGLGILFGAIGRGAYTANVSGSCARLRAWESVAGIVGQPWPSSIATLSLAAERARWFQVAHPRVGGRPIWAVWLVVEAGDRVISIKATDSD